MPVYDPTIWDDDAAKEFLAGILTLDNKSIAEAFLADVLTTAEIKEFGNRMRTAKMLREKKSYDEIRRVTGMSTTTIARVSNWLKKGAGGYNIVLNRMEATNHPHIKLDPASS